MLTTESRMNQLYVEQMRRNRIKEIEGKHGKNKINKKWAEIRQERLKQEDRHVNAVRVA